MERSRAVVWCVVLWAIAVGTAAGCRESAPPAAAQPAAQAAGAVDIEGMRPYLPGQSHIMMDVAYQWENLWFAAKKGNWPLAQFFFDETRSHILWTIRIRPIRKDAEGKDVDIKSIFDAVDVSNFAGVNVAIARKDLAVFEKAYAYALEGCYSCHKASGKPYLKPKIPTGVAGPAEEILDFTPLPAAPKPPA